MKIMHLGEATYPSPIKRTISDNLRISENVVHELGMAQNQGLQFEIAGPRKKLFFKPENVRAGIVTCGGLCPGLNDVIRSIYNELNYAYGINDVIGFKGGYKGIDPDTPNKPIKLNEEFVEDIHKEGGTVLGTSRGPVDIKRAVDNLIKLGVNILFTIGGDGTQRGGNELFQEAKNRNYALSVIGIPKTIDNDVAFVSRTFGYATAVQEATMVLDRAHIEARSVENGISLVKLMGRHAGFIAAGATVASQDVNIVLVPEVPFKLEGKKGFLETLKKRIIKRKHALIVVAEGAGQDLMESSDIKNDLSGNFKLKDIGDFLYEKIKDYFQQEEIPVIVRYFDPSYIIRSVRANAEDSILCDLFARNAVHAAMAGKTGLVIGNVHGKFIHVPIELLVSQSKKLETTGLAWRAVLAATGQPDKFE